MVTDTLKDRVLGLIAMYQICGRILRMYPPRLSQLVESIEADKFEEFLLSLGYEIVEDEDDGEPKSSSRFGDREEFDRSKGVPSMADYGPLRVRRVQAR